MGNVWTAAVTLLLSGIWLAGSGGVTGKMNEGLGLRDGAIATYTKMRLMLRCGLTLKVCGLMTGRAPMAAT